MPKTALILGGTKGLGLALAFEATNNRRMHATIAGRSNLSELNRPYNSRLIKLDLTDSESVEQFAKRRPEPFDYVFWVAGILKRKPFDQMPSEWINDMINTHLSGPIRALQLIHLSLHYLLQHPYHLVTIASTSSWRARENEALYCALKAAKAAFTRNFARELVRDLPGSKVTLINPGGIKTNLFKGTGQDTSNFMDPNIVSTIIWNEVVNQKTPFHEVQIMRNDSGMPDVSYGPRLPEMPFKE